MSAAAPAVDARDLFRVHRTAEGDAAALQGLTLRVQAGEVVAVLGPSGAGKSTLLRVLAGLEAPSAGRAAVLGTELGRLSPGARAGFRAARIGIVDQHHDRALPAALTCLEAVALTVALRGAPRVRGRRRAAELLERVGLADRAGALPAELSGGERQRVAVCAALAHRPGLLLADEPGGELDAAAARAVYDLIAELAREHAATVLVVSHDPAATRIADRTVRLRDGRIAEEAVGDGAEEAIVVGRGGWVRLPGELLAAAGLGGRLRAEAVPGELRLRAAAGSAAETAAPADGPKASPGPAGAAAVAPAPRRRPGLPARLRGVDKAYGERVVLRGFDLDVEPGRLTALSGRSGSGKSTVLRLLAGLEAPDAGAILVGDDALHGRSRSALAALRRAGIGVVEQSPALADHLSAQENVALGLVIRGVGAAEAARIAEARLAEVGLAERVRQRTARLSAGERQRVAIARALAPGPGLLLVDEPTSRLDEAGAASIAALLADLSAVHGTTILCATHEPLVVAAGDAEVALGGG
jgi:ABC-type lipoprotein export system ATPase subunit